MSGVGKDTRTRAPRRRGVIATATRDLVVFFVVFLGFMWATILTLSLGAALLRWSGFR